MDLARSEYGIAPDEAMQMVLAETYNNIQADHRHHFITKATDALIDQNPTFRYVPSDFLLPAKYHYNCGLIEYEGDDWLVYRRQLENADSTICRFNFRTHENFEIEIPEKVENEQFEDPRVFIFDGKIHCAFSSWRKNWAYAPSLRLVRLNADWSYDADVPIPYGGNGAGTIQKNWQFFVHEDELHFIYDAKPWTVVCGDKVYKGKTLSWDYGTVRGGTPPVRVGDFYYTFFHSRLDHGRARYYTGAIKFIAEAPFTPAGMTQVPLLSATDKEPNLRWAPLVSFPCGTIYRNETFIVSLGINDLNCALCDWTLSELNALLRPI